MILKCFPSFSLALGSNILGITQINYNTIIVGANNLMTSAREEVLGTIIHEFIHFAMLLMYNNRANPYTRDDTERIEMMKNITEKCKAKLNEENLFKNVFDLYKDFKFHAELIARVPHFLYTYRNNLTHIQNVNEAFYELFDFYNQTIYPEIIQMIPKMDVREKVDEFNQRFDVLPLMNNIDTKVCENREEIGTSIEKVLKNLNLNASLDNHAILTNSNSSKFDVMQKIHQETKIEEVPSIFMKLSFASSRIFLKTLDDIDKIIAEIILVVDCDDFTNFYKFNDALDSFAIEQVIFIQDDSLRLENYLLKFKISDVIEYESDC